MILSRPTLVAAAALLAWFALDFVGVEQLVSREPLLSLAGLMLAVMAATVALGLVRTPFVAPLYALALAIWASLQIETHWWTYVWPASARKLAWYDRVRGENWSVLPDLPGRTTPDLFHTVLFALILLNLALALRDCLRRA